MTDNELLERLENNVKLATFAGASFKEQNNTHPAYWLFPSGDIVLPEDLNFAKDPRQWFMVLEALVEDYKDKGYWQAGAWSAVLDDLSKAAIKVVGIDTTSNAFNFPQAIIDAAMAVINSKEKQSVEVQKTYPM